MHELDILKWAAGAITPLPRLDNVDQDLILECVREHRLEGRLLRRLKSETQPWAGQALLNELEARQSTSERRVKLQIESMKEIHCDYSLSGQTVIAIKGYTAYFLLGELAALRASWDVDILCSNTSGMRETLTRLGYEWRPNESVDEHHGSPRAYGRDLDVDTYDFIPVWRYPKEATVENLDPRLNPGVWDQVTHPLHSEISVADLLEYSVIGRGPEAGSLIVPDPAMAILIVCTHLFADFLRRFPRRLATLPLVHLAEICELSKHPSFDQQRFASLVRRFNALESVEFASRLLTSAMGYNPLSPFLPSGGLRREWYTYYRFAFWLPATWSDDDLLMPREASEPLRNLLNRLGANEVVATVGHGRQAYSALEAGKGETFERVITRNVKVNQLPMSVSLSWDADVMIVEIGIASLPESELDVVHTEFSGYSSNWHINRDGLVLEGTMQGDNTRASLTFCDQGYTLRLVVPQNVWQDLPRRDRPIPVLVAAVRRAYGRLGRPTSGKVESATLIPMNVVTK